MAQTTATPVDRRSPEDLIQPNAVRDMRLLLALMQDHVPYAQGEMVINERGQLQHHSTSWAVDGRIDKLLEQFNSDNPLDASEASASAILTSGLYQYFCTVQPEMAAQDDLRYHIKYRIDAPTPLRSSRLMAQVTVVRGQSKVRTFRLSEPLDDFYDENNY